MLKLRVITAVLMILVVGGGILLLPAVGLAALFSLLVLIAAWEWAALAGWSSWYARACYSLVVGALLIVAAGYSNILTAAPDLDRVRDVVGVGCLWWAIALLWVKSYPASAALWGSRIVRLAMGLLTLIPAWMGLVYLRSHEAGIALIFLLIAMVAAADIGAYFSGKAWGKAKLAVKVSPGKSWAGFWGGLCTSIGLVLVLWVLFDQHFDGGGHSIIAVIAIALATTLASVLGDLLESMVKRQQGVKDSGRILPGHGGMMDRLDSMTAAAPVFALCLLLAGW